jgi:hypothetical protein
VFIWAGSCLSSNWFCEKMGSGFVEGDVVTDAGLGSGPGAGPRFSSDPGSASSPEDAEGPQARLVTSPSTVDALSSFATMGFEVHQSGSSQVRYAFAGGCVSASAVTVDSVFGVSVGGRSLTSGDREPCCSKICLSSLVDILF